MGGIGSGGYRHSGAKATTDDYRSIDVRRWRRDGLLVPGAAFGWEWTHDGETKASIGVLVQEGRVILAYRARSRGEPWQDMDYPVNLDWTACHLGGKRPWFLCPASGCGRRVAILYNGGNVYACRHCYDLVYESQREKDHHRIARKADRIRRKLGWKVGILNPKGDKPPGMHWKTYQRLVAQHDAYAQVALNGMAEQLRLDRWR